MKSYPSIEGSGGQNFQEFDAFVFDKYDGSNLRAELSKKRGFYKFGTRNRMFDETDPVFGCAINLFKSTWESVISDTAKKERWDSVIIFAEFWGPGSFAGQHEPTDPKVLTLFDVAPHKQGIIGPKEFLSLFGNHEHTAKFLGREKWTRGFVQRVRNGEIPGITCEGVVGKAGTGHDQVRAKAKTQAWIDRVLARYGAEEGQKLVDS